MSGFVLSKVGVTAVAEPCAHLLGGDIIVRKKAINGITIAVARED
jgi:cobalt-precorrin 5A hydrolase